MLKIILTLKKILYSTVINILVYYKFYSTITNMFLLFLINVFILPIEMQGVFFFSISSFNFFHPNTILTKYIYNTTPSTLKIIGPKKA